MASYTDPQTALVTPDAAADLEDISDYIARDSLVAAAKVRGALLTAMRRLGETPGMGHLREDLTDEPLRFWAVYSYLIIYSAEAHPIQILRVLHGARDIRSVLGYT